MASNAHNEPARSPIPLVDLFSRRPAASTSGAEAETIRQSLVGEHGFTQWLFVGEALPPRSRRRCGRRLIERGTPGRRRRDRPVFSIPLGRLHPSTGVRDDASDGDRDFCARAVRADRDTRLFEHNKAHAPGTSDATLRR